MCANILLFVSADVDRWATDLRLKVSRSCVGNVVDFLVLCIIHVRVSSSVLLTSEKVCMFSIAVYSVAVQLWYICIEWFHLAR